MERGPVQRGVGIALAIGVLAFAFVRMRSREYNADIATMKAALREVAMAEAAYHLDSGTFSTGLGRPGSKHGVTVLSASDTSWSAQVTHPDVRRSCTITFSVRRGASTQEVIAARTAAIDGITCG